MAGSLETASRLNFNPDWMGGNAPRSKCPSFSSSQNDHSASGNPYYQQHPPNANDTVLAPPKMSKNRYGREELLALCTSSSNIAPGRLKLDFADFYIEEERRPICLQPFSEAEQILVQGGINSSKVLSTVNHAQQRLSHGVGTQAPVSGGGGGSTSSAGGLSSSGGSRWPPSSGGFGGAGSGGYTGPRGIGRGSGGSGAGADGQFYSRSGRNAAASSEGRFPGGMGRGRFGGPPSRGAASTVGGDAKDPPLVQNTRAQALYDPNDPRDRPRQRLKSTTKTDEQDDQSLPTQPVPHFSQGRGGKYASSSGSGGPAVSAASQQQRRLPEWATDEADDSGATAGVDAVARATGSFDATGNFQPPAAPAQHQHNRLDDDRIAAVQPPLKYRDAVQQPASDATQGAERRSSPKPTAAATGSLAADNGQQRRRPQTFANAAVALAESSDMAARFLRTPADTTASPKLAHSAAAAKRATVEQSPYIKTPAAAKASAPGGMVAGPKKSDEDVLSNLHMQAESLVKSVCLEDNEKSSSSMASARSTITTSAGPAVPGQTGTASAPNDNTWFYIDPSDKCQGPFTSDMMLLWFNSGYFSMDLKVKRSKDTSYTTLGDLIKENGHVPFLQATASGSPSIAPFMQLKQTAASPACGYVTSAPVSVISSAPQQQSIFAAGGNFLTTPTAFPQLPPSVQAPVAVTTADDVISRLMAGVVNADGPPPFPSAGASAAVAANFTGAAYSNTPLAPNGQQTNGQRSNVWDVYNTCTSTNATANLSASESKPANVKEVEKGLQELLERLKQEEFLRRKIEEENKKQAQLREEEMHKKLEEERRAFRELQLKIERETAERERIFKEQEERLRRELELENARRQEEEIRRLEELENKRIMEEMHEKLKEQQRKEAEAERQRLETKKRLQEEIEKQRLEEYNRQQEQARLDAENRRKEEDKAKQLKAEKLRYQQEEERIRKLAAQHEAAAAAAKKRAASAAATGSAWSKPAVQQSEALSNDKVLAATAQSLREIQLEEERQMAAERRQQMELDLLRKEAQLPVLPAGGAWSCTGSKNLKWEPPAESIVVPPAAGRPNKTTAVWKNANTCETGAALNTTSNSDSTGDGTEGFWEEEPAKDERHSKKALTFVNSTHNKSISKNDVARNKNSNNAGPGKRHLIVAAAPQTQDEFSAWCIKQVKKLNKDIDESEAAVFIEFLKHVPDIEVTDYVMGYIPESTASKEFLREFMERRKRALLNNGSRACDEWSVVNKQASTTNNGHNGENTAPIGPGGQQQHKPTTAAAASRKRNKRGAPVRVDGSVLGFKPAGDPNRVNVGQIDSPL